MLSLEYLGFVRSTTFFDLGSPESFDKYVVNDLGHRFYFKIAFHKNCVKVIRIVDKIYVEK